MDEIKCEKKFCDILDIPRQAERGGFYIQYVRQRERSEQKKEEEARTDIGIFFFHFIHIFFAVQVAGCWCDRFVLWGRRGNGRGGEPGKEEGQALFT